MSDKTNKFKSETQGRNSAGVIQAEAKWPTGTGLDTKALAVVWSNRDANAPSEDLLEALSGAVERQRLHVSCTRYISSRTDLDKALSKVKSSLEKLSDVLAVVEKLDSDTYSHLAARFPALDLDEIEDARHMGLRRGNPSLLYYRFVKDIRDALEKANESVGVSDGSLFADVLAEIERQFPGLPRPEDRINQAWRSFIARALRS